MDTFADTMIDEEIPRARLGLLLRHFSELGDDREPWRVMYPPPGGPAVGDLRDYRFVR
jgi:hypothetical protein